MKVLITDPIAAVCPRILRDAGLEVDEQPGLSPEKLVSILPEYEALIVRSGTRVPAEAIAAATRLRVIGRAGVGVDNIDLEAANRYGVVVVNAPGGNTVSTAELTLALMLAVARHLTQANRSLLEGRWERSRFKGIELYGKTLGVIGFGRVGREVTRRATALGMKVLAHDPLISEAAFQAEGLQPSTFDEVISQADFLSVHVPLDESTHHLIDEQVLQRCKRGVRIINCARGGVVDEAALLRALESGQVAAAGLDVFEQEPPGENPLLEHPHVVATPHLGAATTEAQERVAAEIAKHVAEFLLTGKTEGIVNQEVAS